MANWYREFGKDIEDRHTTWCDACDHYMQFGTMRFGRIEGIDSNWGAMLIKFFCASCHEELYGGPYRGNHDQIYVTQQQFDNFKESKKSLEIKDTGFD